MMNIYKAQKVRNASLKVAALLLLLSGLTVKGQTISEDYHDFRKFIAKNYKMPDTVKKDCYWNYAVVKVKTDKNNKVTEVDFVTTSLPQYFKDSFKYLLGYQFAKNVQVRQHPIVFVFTVDQIGGDGCKVPIREGYPSKFLLPVLTDITRQLEEDPSSIILHNPIIMVAGKETRY